MPPVIAAAPFIVHAFIVTATTTGHDMLMAWECKSRYNRNHNDQVLVHKPTGHRVAKTRTSDHPVAVEAGLYELLAQALRDCNNLT